MKRDVNGFRMVAVIDARLSGRNWKEFKDSDLGVTFGGYCFNANVKGKQCDVNFDWDSFAGNVMDDGFLRLETGVSNFFQDADGLSDVYDLEYQEAGFTRHDLTAEVLANAEKIVEFTIDYDDAKPGDYIRLVSICFEKDGEKHWVAGEVLKEFNKEAVRNYLNAFNLNDYDLGGVEITEDDISDIAELLMISLDRNRPFSLPEAVDICLYGIRKILDEGLEEIE